MSKKRNYRRKVAEEKEDEEDEIEDVAQALQDRKELQKIRQRKAGVTPEDLLTGEKDESKDAADNSDPYKLKSGGGLTQVSKSITVSELGTNFSTETNQRDEDVQLLKYIEEGLRKKKGVPEETEKTQR